ncbi:hypothetical protein [Pygmaiobacter massiliensis]|uniref:hypothetical protein n=1 Tax=Pygmaiobacter massiliensis TaxID=1917873 RepID=UPI00289C67D0|nr:hypothetical protein [Pygmaiobacter massiliensis]
MNNAVVCDRILQLQSEHSTRKMYVADQCVKEGYGQSCGGYLNRSGENAVDLRNITQASHFLDYYGDKREKVPTYQYLRCPQLLLFIAEIAGVADTHLSAAYRIVKDYENAEGLRFTKKNANYMWGKQAFRNFKLELQINNLVRIIRKSKTWDEALEQIEKL